MKPDLYWIPGPWPGRLAISARPRGGDWLSDEASEWKQAGLDIIVSLLEPEEAKQLELSEEGTAAKAIRLGFISFPIPDRGVPNSAHDTVILLKRIAHALEEGKNVAIHCRQGIGRSGLIAAGVLVTTGVAPTRAIEIVSSARGLTIPETDSQLRWVQQLPAESLVEN